jgi:hypothetical protein
MSVSRRALLGGAALVAAAGAVGIGRMTGRAQRPQVVLYDSRKPASLAFAHRHKGARLLDLASEQSRNWSGVRALRREGAIAGLTGWNDYVAARQWLEERGLRVQAQDHDRAHDLIAWTMA